MKPTIFIGSSSEQIEIAEAVELNLSEFADITCWKYAFKAGNPFIEDLINAKNNHDYAVFIITPDDIVFSRDEKHEAPRDNIVFELGLFIGSLGRERVYAICDENIKSKIMSDYSGVTFLTYNGKRNDGKLPEALNPACIRIKNRIKEIERHTQSKPKTSGKIASNNELIGLEKIYDNYHKAEKDIIYDLNTTKGPVRLFFQIAAQNIGNKGSIFDVVREVCSKKSIEFRILHSTEDSPLFARDRLLSKSKDPDAIRSSIRYVSESLRLLENQIGATLRHRSHNWPFIWRIYGFEEKLYLMPYFADKDATQKSPVLLFKKSDNSLFTTFVELFDFTWEQQAPKELKISDIITPATPSGTALFLKWEGFHVFGIPRRDVIQESEFVRFYGVGGKRDNPNESWVDCAIREGNEETNRAIDEIEESEKTSFFRANGIIENINIVSENKRPRLILEKRKHTGYGSMAKSADHYYLIAFNASLKKKPEPNGELAVMVFLKDQHLSMIRRRSDVTVAELQHYGAIFETQEGIDLDRNKVLVPHGTAVYVMRQLPETKADLTN